MLMAATFSILVVWAEHVCLALRTNLKGSAMVMDTAVLRRHIWKRTIRINVLRPIKRGMIR